MGVEELLRLGEQRRFVAAQRRAGHAGHTDLRRECLGGDLVPHQRDDLRGRADEADPALTAGAREVAVLGEKPVAGVDRVDSRRHRDVEDLGHPQVRVDRPLPVPDPIRLVGLVPVLVHSVFVAVDRDGADPQLVAGAKDANRDLAAVGAHQLSDRGHGRGGLSGAAADDPVDVDVRAVEISQRLL